MYCIVLYYEALYWWPIRPLSYRHSSGVVRNLHSTLAEWGIFNLWFMSPQGTHPFNCAPTQFYQQCPCYHIMNDMLDCYMWASNHQPFDYWRAHHVHYVASQPRTSDRLISHWRALCLLTHDNWRCSIQPEIFTYQNFAWAGIRSQFDSGRILCAYR